MNDLEISKALALAIGWKHLDILPSKTNTDFMQCWVWLGYAWKQFDYRDPAVIWPIAAKFDCFPAMFPDGRWGSWNMGLDHFGETPEKSVALAVINRNKS